MSLASVSHRHVFGVKADCGDNVHVLDEQTVLYPAGNNLVLFNMETRTQKFLPGTEGSGGITALTVSTNRRYAAVAERFERPTISIYDLHTLRKRKVKRNSCPPLSPLQRLSTPKQSTYYEIWKRNHQYCQSKRRM